MEQIIEGTWDEIKKREAEFAGHEVMLIVDPVEPPNTIRDKAHLEELLLEGLNSGPAIEVTPEYVEAERARLIDKYIRKRRK